MQPLEEVGMGLWLSLRFTTPGVSLRDALGYAAGTELALSRLSLGRLPGMGLNPLPARSVGHGEASQVGDGALSLSLSLGLCASVLGASGYVSADLGVFQFSFPLVYLGLDVGRGQGYGPVVPVDGALEFAPVHRLQQRRLVGQLEGPHRRVEHLGKVGLPGRRRANRLCRVGDPG